MIRDFREGQIDDDALLGLSAELKRLLTIADMYSVSYRHCLQLCLLQVGAYLSPTQLEEAIV